MTKIYQYIHRPNNTELGKGNTHETYLLISKDVDLSHLFPPGQEVKVNDLISDKSYYLKSAEGNEFRVNQMGPIYRDYDVCEGDDVLLTKIEGDEQSIFTIRVVKHNRITIFVTGNGATIGNIERLSEYGSKTDGYSISVQNGDNINKMTISFDAPKLKRSDSPDTTDFYKINVADQPLKNGKYLFDVDTKELIVFEKYSYNTIDLNGENVISHLDKSSVDFVKKEETVQTILYGPPGTGKTYEMQKIFAGYPEGNRSVITFHQSYSYEEFIIGLKAKTKEDGNIEYSYEKGVFYNACERAAVLAGYSSLAECCSDTKESRNAKFAAIAGDTSRQFLFCIDEINRANISAVFGDLISLIEENKRLGAQNEMIVRLPYTQELFGVPANLRLLGTMNTADRSIQILDTALRRRFQFKEYLPDYDVLRNEKAKTVLQAINDRIRALLGQDRQIGHSYFYDIEASAADESIRILKALANKIIPLLQEYFYNDVEKIRFVLGEKDRIPDEHSFYIEDGDATAAFSRYDSDSEETSFYILNTEGIESASMSNESASAFIDHITA